MELTDILPLEKWVVLEKDITGRSGLDASVFNTDGIRITDFRQWANRLCPAIKATDKGQSFICAVAHMNLAMQAMKTKKSVIEECDAGLMKLVVPIFADEAFVGAVGACGFLLDDGELDNFMINRTTEIDEEEIENLSEGIKTITTGDAELLVAYIEGQIESIVSDFKNQG
ncbi:MAG: hypothetical protein DRI57_02240 [Deltaproteobacteria bacterium]|nr:MAG: hypothetical protein DRI57_02240 [Deltaproteobacteria bacterium]